MAISIFESIGHIVGENKVLLALRDSHIAKALGLTDGNPLANMFCVTKDPIEQSTFNQIHTLTSSMTAMLQVTWRVVKDDKGNVVYAIVHGSDNQAQYTPTVEEVGAKLNTLLSNSFPLVDVPAFINFLSTNDDLSRQFIDSAQQTLVNAHNVNVDKLWAIAYVNLGVGENTAAKLQPCVIERNSASSYKPMLVNQTWLNKALFVDGQPLDATIVSALKSVVKIAPTPTPAQTDTQQKLPVEFVDSPEGKDGLTTAEALARIQNKYESRNYSACQFDSRTATFYFLNGKNTWEAKAFAVVNAYDAVAK